MKYHPVVRSIASPALVPHFTAPWPHRGDENTSHTSTEHNLKTKELGSDFSPKVRKLYLRFGPPPLSSCHQRMPMQSVSCVSSSNGSETSLPGLASAQTLSCALVGFGLQIIRPGPLCRVHRLKTLRHRRPLLSPREEVGQSPQLASREYSCRSSFLRLR